MPNLRHCNVTRRPIWSPGIFAFVQQVALVFDTYVATTHTLAINECMRVAMACLWLLFDLKLLHVMPTMDPQHRLWGGLEGVNGLIRQILLIPFFLVHVCVFVPHIVLGRSGFVPPL